MDFYDALTVDGAARICRDGSLVASVRAARIGVQQYLGSEVDPNNEHGLRDMAVVNVDRPEEEVFSVDSLASFAAAPVTIDHPTVAVDASNWKRLGVGEINGDIARDGQFVRVPIIVRDAASVAKVSTTHKQLSMGYSCQLDFSPRTLADGTTIHATQRNIKINHIAAVRAARGGPELKISDERPAPILEKHMKKIVLDGLQVDLSDADAVAAAISKLQDKIAAADVALVDANTAHDKAMAAKDAEIDGLKAQVVDQAQIDALADAKAEVVGKGKTLLGDKMPETAGKSVADVRRMVVAAKLGDAAVADKSDDYVEARFDGLTADSKPAAVDALANVIKSGVRPVMDSAAIRDHARASRYAN